MHLRVETETSVFFRFRDFVKARRRRVGRGLTARARTHPWLDLFPPFFAFTNFDAGDMFESVGLRNLRGERRSVRRGKVSSSGVASSSSATKKKRKRQVRDRGGARHRVSVGVSSKPSGVSRVPRVQGLLPDGFRVLRRYHVGVPLRQRGGGQRQGHLLLGRLLGHGERRDRDFSRMRRRFPTNARGSRETRSGVGTEKARGHASGER